MILMKALMGWSWTLLILGGDQVTVLTLVMLKQHLHQGVL